MQDLAILGWKLEACPPFEKSKKIVENRRFSENGWPKSKSNTGNGFPGVDYIYLDTSYVPIKVNLPGGGGRLDIEFKGKYRFWTKKNLKQTIIH